MRRASLWLAAAILAVSLAACSIPTTAAVLNKPVDQVTPADQKMVSDAAALLIMNHANQAHGDPVWATLAECIIQNESGGNPTAQNPTSSASGLFQDLDSTWNGYGGYSRAMYAPPEVQWAMNYALYQADGLSPWAGDPCVG